MKSIILFFILTLSLNNFLLAKSIPFIAKEHFKSTHPHAQKIKWSKEKDEFEVEFKENGKKMSCSYNQQGNIIETETEIKINDLPMQVQDAIHKAYPNYSIEDIEEVMKPNSKLQYEMELELGKDEFEVLVSLDGMTITKKIE